MNTPSHFERTGRLMVLVFEENLQSELAGKQWPVIEQRRSEVLVDNCPRLHNVGVGGDFHATFRQMATLVRNQQVKSLQRKFVYRPAEGAG